MARFAYLILAHKNPGQVRRLLSLLDNPSDDIYVHIDAKASFTKEALEGCCKHSGVFFIEPRISVRWGGASMMKAELALLKSACGAHYDYYHLLSGMDLPLKDSAAVHSFFEKNPGKEFLMMWKPAPAAFDRAHYYRLFPEGNRFFLTNFINNVVQKALKRLGVRVNDGLDIRFASQWFTIEDGFASYVVGKSDYLCRTFGHSNISDEIFLPTLLMSSEYAGRLYDSTEYVENEDIDNTANMRFVDWRRSGNGRHPWTFTAADYDMLVSKPHLWARKFDESRDSEIIDLICRKLKR